MGRPKNEKCWACSLLTPTEARKLHAPAQGGDGCWNDFLCQPISTPLDFCHSGNHLNASIPFWNLPEANKTRLQDPNYAKVDRLTGGILFSSNDAPSILTSIIKSIAHSTSNNKKNV